MRGLPTSGWVKLLLAAAAMASLIATSAFAADLPARVYTKAPPPMVAVYNWTGFYIGGNVGYSWGREKTVDMVGASPAFLELQDRIAKVARYRESVLMCGESGVGKEQLAESIYLLSESNGRPSYT